VRRAHRALHRGQDRTATFEHEATTSKISDDMLFYCQSRGLNEEEAVALIVNGFVRTCCSSCRWSSWPKRRS
jgi:Fe-S cluster assembly scaffold protein SufB